MPAQSEHLRNNSRRSEAQITGIGVLSPIGNTAEEVLMALRCGRHGIAPVERLANKNFRANFFGEIKNFREQEWLTPQELAEFEDPYLRYAIVAARQALADAKIAAGAGQLRRDIALVLATCNGGLASAEAEYSWKHGLAERPFDEAMNLQAQMYGFGKALAAALQIRGEAWVVTTACSSSTVALGLAQTLINRNYYDIVLVGASDGLCLANVAGFDAIKATSAGLMAPFSNPPGLNIGEAACFWAVENSEKAAERGARCLGRIIGQASTSDAYHPTTPDPRGIGVTRTLKEALADSGLEIAQLGCINAHGSGTEANDKAESKGIARFLNGHPVPVVSTKSYFGHCMGVAGILEATSQLLAMNDNFIPPTLNFSEPRPGCALDYVPNTPRPLKYDAFLSANYAFGGNNAAVIIAKSGAEIPPRPVKSERVVITGQGTVTSLGFGIQATLEKLRAGAVGISEVTNFPTEQFAARRAGQVPAFTGADIDRRIDFASLNPISRFAVAAGRLALIHAGLKITPLNGEDVGVVIGTCNGTSEMAHMDSVFGKPGHMANIPSFSNITPNSVAGWVSTELYLKGVNATLSPGPHGGLQALAYAFDAVAEGRSRTILAGAADEMYQQTFSNYDSMGFLYSGEEERDFRLRPESAKRKVLGEGAAMLVLESLESAKTRGAKIYAEILSYGMSMDGEGFLSQNLGTAGIQHAATRALARANVCAEEVGLIVWAPQGNRQDTKVLTATEEILGAQFEGTPFVTTTFNTGYIESASILVSLAAILGAEGAIWPQRTGDPRLDSRTLRQPSGLTLVLGSCDVGYNFATLLKLGPES